MTRNDESPFAVHKPTKRRIVVSAIILPLIGIGFIVRCCHLARITDKTIRAPLGENTIETLRWFTWEIMASGTCAVLILVMLAAILLRAYRLVGRLYNHRERLMMSWEHDLGNSANQMLTQLYCDRMSGRDPAETLAEIERQINEQREIIAENLEYQRDPSFRDNSLGEELDLRDIVNGRVSVYKTIAKVRNLAFDCSLPDEPVMINASRRKILLAVKNLLSNAVKYTAEGGIRLTLEAKEDKAVLSVADTGCGMKRSTVKRMFKRFQRGLSCSGTDGYGLGLAIAKEAIATSRGRLLCQTELGKGTTFTIELPLSKAMKLPPPPPKIIKMTCFNQKTYNYAA